MPRPSRREEAQQRLRTYYEEYGAMPSISAFAQMMGYRSPSSAHDVALSLVKQGFLAREGRAGRLLPGPLFGREPHVLPDVPRELLAALPTGVPLRVVLVGDWLLEGAGVLKGDSLVLAPIERQDLSQTLLLALGEQRTLARAPQAGWDPVGVVVAQFRTYLSRSD